METERLTNQRWYQRDLNPPPVFVYCCAVTTKDLLRDGNEVMEALVEATNTLKSLKQLEVDFIILKKLMFKFGAVLKRHKQFKAIQQFSKCIRSFFEINMYKVYSEIADVWSKCARNSASLKLASLPSKQMWQFVLARTCCMVHLLTQACSYGLNALQYSYEKLQSGLFVPSNVVITGCISRLWTLCAVVAGRGVQWYNILHPWLEKLTSSPIEWLNIGEILPVSLSSLQTGKHLQVILSKSRERSGYIKQLTDSLTDATNNKNYQFSAEDKRQLHQRNVARLTENPRISTRQMEDVGIIVARTNTALKDCNASSENVHKMKVQDDFPSFTKMKHLNSWLKKETTMRKNGKARSSARLNATQWSALRKFVRGTPKSSFEHVSQVVRRWLIKPNFYLKKYKRYKLSINDDDVQSGSKTQENLRKREKSKKNSLINSTSKSSQILKGKRLRKWKLQIMNAQPDIPDKDKMQSKKKAAKTSSTKLQANATTKAKKSVAVPVQHKQHTDDIEKIFRLLD